MDGCPEFGLLNVFQAPQQNVTPQLTLDNICTVEVQKTHWIPWLSVKTC